DDVRGLRRHATSARRDAREHGRSRERNARRAHVLHAAGHRVLLLRALDGHAAPRRRSRRPGMSSGVLLFLTTFVASAVEAVEALTIVLALGVVRGWRSTLLGVGAAALALAAVVVALGSALGAIPIDTLRLVVGALLLAFGVQWLRKAIVRASGLKPLHDEAAAFA